MSDTNASAEPTISDILSDLKNSLVWESQQDWKDDYDREGNRNNFVARAEAAINRHAYDKAIRCLPKKIQEFPKDSFQHFPSRETVAHNKVIDDTRQALAKEYGIAELKDKP